MEVHLYSLRVWASSERQVASACFFYLTPVVNSEALILHSPRVTEFVCPLSKTFKLSMVIIMVIRILEYVPSQNQG